MTQETATINPRIARGAWQREIWAEMCTEFGADNPLRFLRGRAARELPNYQQSLANMLARAVESGYVVEKTLGPRGGSWSAVYRAHLGSFGAYVVRAHDAQFPRGRLLRVMYPPTIGGMGFVTINAGDLARMEKSDA